MSEESEERIIITQGEIATFDIFLEKKSGFPRPIDLTNFDTFKVCLPLTSGDFLTLTEVANANGSVVAKVSPDTNGQINVIVNSVDTLLLNPGFAQDIDIEWDNSITPNTKRKKIEKALNIVESNCA
jgi:hypothetical protein